MAKAPLDLRKGKSVPIRRSVRPARGPEPIREARRAPLRVRRKRRRLALWGGVVFVLASIVYGIHWASYLPELSIQDIAVSGTTYIDPELVRERVEQALHGGSGFISPRNLWWYNGSDIEHAVESDLYRVARASVSRNSFFSNTLNVAIDERAPYAHWCAQSGECFVVDETGFAFAPYASTSDRLTEQFVFTGGIGTSTPPLGSYVAPARFASTLSILRALGQAGYTPESANFDSDTDLSVQLDKSFVLYVAYGADPQAVVRNLKLTLSSDPLRARMDDIEYVDMRFGNRVFYKLKGEEVVGE